MGWTDWIPPVLARKASQTAKMIVTVTGGRPIWTPRDFGKLAKEGFETNVTVYSCVMEVARSAAGVPWVLYRKGRNSKKRTEIESHPLLDLLDKPNPFQDQAAFIEAQTAFLLLSGNAYWEAVGPGGKSAPMELWGLRPDRMRVIPGYKNLIAGYRYSIGTDEQDFPADLVMHQKLFSPSDDWYGLSPLAVAARAVDADNSAQAWNVALLQNSARPSGALISKATQLSDDQIQRLREDLQEGYSSPRNAGRPMLLEGDFDWKQFALSPADMDFLNGRKMSKLEICQVFGVPPELIGDHEHATYSNFQEARKAFYQETILPYLDRLRGHLNNWLVPMFGDGLYLDYDLDEIEALQEERQKVWDSAITAADKGILTINEAREKMGYEARPEGDVLLIPATKIPLGAEPAPADDPDDEEPAKEATKALVRHVKAFGLGSDAAKAAYWKQLDRAREAWASKFAGQVRALFGGDAKAVVKAVKEAGPNGAIAAADGVIDERRADWERVYTASYLAVIEAFSEATTESLKAGAPRRQVKALDVFSIEVRNFIAATIAKRLKKVSQTTKDRVRDAILDGLAGGEGIDDIAQRVQTAFNGFSQARAVTIARTEVIGAANFGSRSAAKATGLPLQKEWIETKDSHTRDSHRPEAEGGVGGQLRPMDEKYSNGLMFPGDPDGDSEEVIGCRCAEGYHVEDEDDE